MGSLERFRRLLPWLLLALALVVRGALWVEWRAWPGARVAVLDPSWHLAFAERVLSGDLDGGDRTWVVAPGLGFLFALAGALGGAGTAAPALLLLGFDLLAVEAVRRLGERAAGPWAGALAGLTVALAPNLPFHALTLLGPSPPLALLALAGLLALGSGGRAALGSGVLLGLSCYLRPNQLLLLPVLALVAAWPEGAAAPTRAGGRRAAAVALGLGLALLPGLARNLWASGDAVAISANGGANLYMAHEPGSWSVQLTPPPVANNLDAMTTWLHQEAERGLGRALSPGEADAWWRARALENIQQDWNGALQRTAARLYVALATWSQHDHYAYDAHRREQRLLGALPDPSWLLPGLALVGARLLWRAGRRRELALLGGLVLGLALSLAPFGVVERYRLPGWAGLVPLAACGLTLGLARPRELLWAPAISLLLSSDPFVGRLVLPDLLAGGPALSWSQHAGVEREAAEASNVGAALARSGEPALALDFYARAVSLDDRRLADQTTRAGLLLALGRAEEAARDLQALVAKHPQRWDFWFQLALAKIQTGDPTAARAALDRASALGAAPELVQSARLALDTPHAEP